MNHLEMNQLSIVLFKIMEGKLCNGQNYSKLTEVEYLSSIISNYRLLVSRCIGKFHLLILYIFSYLRHYGRGKIYHNFSKFF